MVEEFNYKERFIHQLEFLLDDWDDWLKITEITMSKETMQGLLNSLKKNDDKLKREGAIEELKRIEEAWHHIGSKGVCNYIEKRIKKLEEESGKK